MTLWTIFSTEFGESMEILAKCAGGLLPFALLVVAYFVVAWRVVDAFTKGDRP